MKGGKGVDFKFGAGERLKNIVSQLIVCVMKSSKKQELQPNNELKTVAEFFLENRSYQNAALVYFARNAL